MPAGLRADDAIGPAALVVVACSSCVSTCRARTAAPEIAPPVLSVTVPTIAAVGP
jgi:hypothetical protein